MKIKVIDTNFNYSYHKGKVGRYIGVGIKTLKKEVELYFLDKYNTDNEFKALVDNKGFITVCYKSRTNEILVFAKVSKNDFEGWKTISYPCEIKQKDWFLSSQKDFTNIIRLVNRSETINEKKQLIKSLEVYSNHELKNNRRAEETLSFRDLNLLTAKSLLDVPLKLIKKYRRYGFSSNSFNSHYYIYIHEKDIKFVDKNLDKILRDEKVKEIIKQNK